MKKLISFCLIFLFFFFGCKKEPSPAVAELNESANALKTTIVQNAPVLTFQPAGDFGGPGNVLTPGDFFPPDAKSKATLKRNNNFLQFNIHTKGLPPGAYTVWWIIFNEPSECADPNFGGGACAGNDASLDLFLASTSVLWATGGVVHGNGIGNFSDRLYVGESRDEQLLGDTDSPLTNPQGAEVHFAIKYHGLASEDPDVLYDQTHLLLGNCGGDGGANSYDLGFLVCCPPFDAFAPYQCFDPQVVIFSPPT